MLSKITLGKYLSCLSRYVLTHFPEQVWSVYSAKFNDNNVWVYF